MTEEKERLFIAVELPAELLVKIEEWSNELKKKIKQQCGTDHELKWVKAGNIHITLKFLGETETVVIPELIKRLETVFADIPVFDLKTGCGGVFSADGDLKVIWLGLKTDRYSKQRLLDLHVQIENVCTGLGFAPDRKTFRPHLTLARAKAAVPAQPVNDLMRNSSLPGINIIPVKKISLIKSTLRREGPEYNIIWRGDLKQPASADDK